MDGWIPQRDRGKLYRLGGTAKRTDARGVGPPAADDGEPRASFGESQTPDSINALNAKSWRKRQKGRRQQQGDTRGADRRSRRSGGTSAHRSLLPFLSDGGRGRAAGGGGRLLHLNH